VQAHAVETRLVAQVSEGAADRVRPPRPLPVGVVAEEEGALAELEIGLLGTLLVSCQVEALRNSLPVTVAQ
jgi:hypothetical protein